VNITWIWVLIIAAVIALVAVYFFFGRSKKGRKK
jgi:branched-subunit amino acid ABC-type transport system permease component